MKLNLPYRTGTVRVSSPYGMRTLSGVREMHKGVDLVGSDKTIVAPCDGKIGWAGEYNDKLRGGNTWEWGKYIRIETEDGYKIYLCHMAAVAVKAGQAVKAGDVLGREGTTGKSTGSHCHFEVRYGGKSTDPTPMLGIANRAGSYPVQAAEPGEDFAEMVCKKAGLEAQTRAYLDKYKYAGDLWRKLWAAMKQEEVL